MEKRRQFVPNLVQCTYAIMKAHDSTGRPLTKWEIEGLYPSVSVIVLNYREPETTSECLSAIASLRYPGHVEVLVVDNGSGDASVQRLRAAAESSAIPIKILANEQNLGFTGGILTALPDATGDLICLLNNDAPFHPDCLARLVNSFRGRTDLGAVWPFDAPLAWHKDLRVPDTAQLAHMRNGTHSLIGSNIWLPLMSNYTECFTPSGVCLLFHRGEDIPFPAEYFAYYEDVYFGWRLQLRGLKAERVLEAVVYHEGSLTGRFEPELRNTLAFHADKNRLANLIIFFAIPTLIRILPLLLLDEAKKLTLVFTALLTGSDGILKLRNHIRVRMWLLRHANWIRSRRRQIQAERRVRDREILQLMSGRITMVHTLGGRFLNFVSLTYCRITGLCTVEFRK